jgi:G3E family GTPase
MIDERVDVHVLTGFLGSGKTTALRRLLADPRLTETAVLVNEFGAVGIDHLLVEAVNGQPVLLSGGCVCCQLRGDVSQALRDLWRRRASGEIPPFNRVIFETTGLADPMPIMATLISDRALRHHFRPGHVITTVDLVNGAATLQRYRECARQVTAADILLVTKCDLGGAESRTVMTGLLRAANPMAQIEAITDGAAEPDLLLNSAPEDQVARAARWLDAAPNGMSRHARIVASVIEHDRPIDWADFGLWFSLLAHRHGAKILRMKGILSLQGSATQVLVQAAQHLVHRPEHLPAGLRHGSRSSLVLITDGLDTALLHRSFAVMVGRSCGRAD